MKFDFFQVISSSILGVFSYYVGGFTLILKIFLFLMVIDYITGLLQAWYNKNISSKIGIKGIMKKIALFLLVVVANIVQIVLDIPIREIVIFYLVSNEIISILENLSSIGVPVPPILSDALKQIKNKSSKDAITKEKK